MIRAVIDSNVFISGLMTPLGIPASLIRAWRASEFTLVTSSELLDEFERAIGYPKVRNRLVWSGEDIARLLELLRAIAIDRTTSLTVDKLSDQDDLKFIEAAVSGNADYLVTGDSAVLRLGSFGTVTFVTPRRFLVVLEAQGKT